MAAPFSVKLTGDKEYKDFLKKLSRRSPAEADKALNSFALRIQSTARKKIQRGKRSGRKYKIGKNRFHTASAPGEPPKTRTGNLIGSIEIVNDRFNKSVGTEVKYGRILEEKMDRLWLAPSVEENIPLFLLDLQKGFKRAAR